jgi:phosphatidylglycerophosphatase C
MMPGTAIRTVAAFDLDGTLTRHDTLLPFLSATAGPVALAKGLIAVGIPLTQAVLVDSNRRRGDMKSLVLERVLGGSQLADLRVAGQRYAHKLLAGGLRDSTLALWREHVDAGHELVIVSASLELYVHPLAVLLGGTAGLGTRLQVRPDGSVSGEIDGENCRGPEKVRRLDEWLRESGSADPGSVEVFAYGDSSGDDDLLARASRPTRLRRR